MDSAAAARYRDDDTNEAEATAFVAQGIADNCLSVEEVRRAVNEHNQTSFVSLPPAQCDECGSDTYTGKLNKCGVCLVSYYCTKSCQRIAWRAGHKQECGTLREQCERDGVRIVAALKAPNASAFERMSHFEALDMKGKYDAAVDAGLHGALRSLLLNDIQDGAGKHQVAIHEVFMILFRGQRKSRASGTFAKVDSSRIVGFLMSAPDATDILMDCCAMMAGRVQQPRNRGIRPVHQQCRDTWAFLSMALCKERVARALMCVGSEGQRAHIMKLGETMRKVLNTAAGASEVEDPNSVIEANANQVAAIFALWCREFETGVDFDSLIKLKGQRRAMYQQMAVPAAVRLVQHYG
jgi:hypothetical protein